MTTPTTAPTQAPFDPQGGRDAVASVLERTFTPDNPHDISGVNLVVDEVISTDKATTVRASLYDADSEATIVGEVQLSVAVVLGETTFTIRDASTP